MPSLDDHLVDQHEAWYVAHPAHLRRALERGRAHLPHIVDAVERRGLPTELALLPIVESGFDPRAVSTAGASGLWQFTAETAKAFGLLDGDHSDQRQDVVASTAAALEYLRQLHARFGDWHLALAAYNWGPSNMDRVMAGLRASGKAQPCSSLPLPDETRHYVPRLQALKNLIARQPSFVRPGMLNPIDTGSLRSSEASSSKPFAVSCRHLAFGRGSLRLCDDSRKSRRAAAPPISSAWLRAGAELSQAEPSKSNWHAGSESGSETVRARSFTGRCLPLLSR